MRARLSTWRVTVSCCGLQDTTELDFNGQQIQGLGPLSYEAQRGIYLHPTLAFSPEREPLDVLASLDVRARAQGRRRRPSEREGEHALGGVLQTGRRVHPVSQSFGQPNRARIAAFVSQVQIPKFLGCPAHIAPH